MKKISEHSDFHFTSDKEKNLTIPIIKKKNIKPKGAFKQTIIKMSRTESFYLQAIVKISKRTAVNSP